MTLGSWLALALILLGWGLSAVLWLKVSAWKNARNRAIVALDKATGARKAEVASMSDEELLADVKARYGVE